MHELVSKLEGGCVSARFHLASRARLSRRELQNGGPSAGPNFQGI